VKGIVSFHPVDLTFFDDLIAPLLAGGKVNPEAYLAEAVKIRQYSWRARRFPIALEMALAESEPPRIERGAGLLRNLRSQLERFDHREDEATQRLKKAIDPDLHVHGRPFFVTEGSAGRVAERIDEFREAPSAESVDDLALEQLLRVGPELGRAIEPEDGPEMSADLAYRGDLMARMKDLYDIARFARQNEKWGEATGGRRRDAIDVLGSEVPWRAAYLHSRTVPFWIARDVDGLETVCGAAGIPAPDFLVPPWRLFAEACNEFPVLKEALGPELEKERDIGAFIAPSDVSELLAFLSDSGARIIQVASQHGEGPACTTLLRKIRECATYAERHGRGYLEAAGLLPPDLD
jgi:hypothetical protein